jgi:hypothetical protein
VTANLGTPQLPEHAQRLNSLLALFVTTVHKHPGIPVPDLRYNLRDATDYEFGIVESACMATGGISRVMVNGEPRYYQTTGRTRSPRTTQHTDDTEANGEVL